MPLLQSLGLAPAKNAIRKLFRRSPADNGLKDQDPSSSWSLPGADDGAENLALAHDSSPPLASHTNTDTDVSKHTQNLQPTTTHRRSDVMQIPMPAADQFSSQADKENRPPPGHGAEDLVASVKKLTIETQHVGDGEADRKVEEEVIEDPAVLAERAHHLRFIEEALDMARLALRTNETPVGCVLVHNGTIIAKGMNATNVTRNGTRHAEFMAISALLSYPLKDAPRRTSLRPKNLPRPPPKTPDDSSDATSVELKSPDEGNEDGKKSHLYPYGQKFHPDYKVNREIIRECILYVTVEPCVMCASLLRQLGVKKVYFGAVNDKFGGTGGVFSIHANSLPIREDGQTASAHPTPRPSQLPDGSGTLGTSYPPGGGDGGNVEAGYEIEGGWGRDEAVGLLRRFYVQENGRAPVPRKKEGRAARLAAMMEKDGDAGPDSPVDSAHDGQEVQGNQEHEAPQEDEAEKEGIDPSMSVNNSPEKLADAV